MSLANSFSGGLFLAIALVHILPDVVGDYAEWVEKRKVKLETPLLGEEEKRPFPLPFVLVFAGYAFILLVDKVMFDSHSLFDHGHGHGHGHGHEEKAGAHDHHDH